MSFTQALPFILLGVLIALLPVGVIGLFASKILPQRRAAFLLIYGGLLFLLVVMVADVFAAVPSRLAVDLVLLIGELALGIFTGELLPIRWLRNGKGGVSALGPVTGRPRRPCFGCNELPRPRRQVDRERRCRSACSPDSHLPRVRDPRRDKSQPRPSAGSVQGNVPQSG